MNRWNDFYNRMTPKKNYVKNTKSSAKIESGTLDGTHLRPLGKLKNRSSTAVGESYVSRREDVGTVSHQVDQRQNDSNFAWVD